VSISELEASALTSSFKPRFFKTSSTIQKIPIIFISSFLLFLFLYSYLLPPEGRKIKGKKIFEIYFSSHL
jgi:hypothetical protein